VIDKMLTKNQSQRKIYNKRYRDKNKDKTKVRNKDYYLKNQIKRRQQRIDYYHNVEKKIKGGEIKNENRCNMSILQKEV